MTKTEITVTVNGKAYTETVEPRLTLVDFLRDKLHLTGTHVGCEHGVCGACSILLDGDPIRSCLMLAVQAKGKSVTTVEGLSNDDGSTGLLQDAFQDAHALQCGYCTPGMLISAQALLDTVNEPPSVDAIKEAIGGNLCRCTGYVQIVEAIQLAATRKFEVAK
jgi:carbon-monoxide dehydrogenase small subunit